MKIAFRHAGLRVGPWVTVTNADWHANRSAVLQDIAKLELPLFVKPARGGSSLGITCITMLSELEQAIEHARQYDTKVVVEQGILGREIECGVLDGLNGATPKASYPGEIVVTDDVKTSSSTISHRNTNLSTALSCPARQNSTTTSPRLSAPKPSPHFKPWMHPGYPA